MAAKITIKDKDKVGPADISAIAKAHVMGAMDVIVELMNDPEVKDTTRLRAAEIILDRSFGKPKQSTDVNITGEVSVQHQHLVAIREAADQRLRQIDATAEADEAKEALRPAIEGPRGRAAINNPREAVAAA